MEFDHALTMRLYNFQTHQRRWAISPMADLNPIHSWLSHATLSDDFMSGTIVRTLNQELSAAHNIARIGQWR